MNKNLPNVMDACSSDADDERWLEVTAVVILSDKWWL
jgi:hypothetical protein